jgi:hypothetical protein
MIFEAIVIIVVRKLNKLAEERIQADLAAASVKSKVKSSEDNQCSSIRTSYSNVGSSQQQLTRHYYNNLNSTHIYDIDETREYQNFV